MVRQWVNIVGLNDYRLPLRKNAGRRNDNSMKDPTKPLVDERKKDPNGSIALAGGWPPGLGKVIRDLSVWCTGNLDRSLLDSAHWLTDGAEAVGSGSASLLRCYSMRYFPETDVSGLPAVAVSFNAIGLHSTAAALISPQTES